MVVFEPHRRIFGKIRFMLLRKDYDKIEAVLTVQIVINSLGY